MPTHHKAQTSRFLTSTDRNFANLPVLGVPASLAFGCVAHFVMKQELPTDVQQLRCSLHDLRSRRLRLISFSSRRSGPSVVYSE